LIQMSQMPNRRGNVTGKTAGPATAAAGGKIDGGRKFMPSATENYVGNPDRIQERQLYNSVGNKK
jgi:hypothetical protein